MNRINASKDQIRPLRHAFNKTQPDHTPVDLAELLTLILPIKQNVAYKH